MMTTLLNPGVRDGFKNIVTFKSEPGSKMTGYASSDFLSQLGGGSIGFILGKLSRWGIMAVVKSFGGGDFIQQYLSGGVGSAVGAAISVAAGRFAEGYAPDSKLAQAIAIGAYTAALHNIVVPFARNLLPAEASDALGVPYYETMGDITASDAGGTFSPMPVLGAGYAVEAESLGDEPSMYNAVAVGDEDSVQLVAMH